MIQFLLAFMLWFGASCEAQILFSKPPKEFVSQIEVAICFIKKSDGEILFLKRQIHKPEGNTWGIPGGKLDPGETPAQAVIREVSEETGLQLEKDSIKYLGKAYLHSSRDVTLHVFEADLPKDTLSQVHINPQEHQAYVWLPLNRADHLKHLPGEEEVIEFFYG